MFSIHITFLVSLVWTVIIRQQDRDIFVNDNCRDANFRGEEALNMIE